MLIKPEIYLVARCPRCQEYILYRSLSLFSLRGTRPKTVTCRCGAKAFVLRLSGKKHLYVDTDCPYCLIKHSYIYELSELKKEYPLSLNCNDTEMHLAYLGQRETVLNALNEEGTLIISYADSLEEYFAQPSIMARALQQINRLFALDAISCGNCGGHNFNLEVQSQRIGIHCNKCGAQVWILARRPSDLLMLKRVDKIALYAKRAYLRFSPKKKPATN